jgi:hypothetical protein
MVVDVFPRRGLTLFLLLCMTGVLDGCKFWNTEIVDVYAPESRRDAQKDFYIQSLNYHLGRPKADRIRAIGPPDQCRNQSPTLFLQLTRNGQTIFLTEHTGEGEIGGAVYFVVPDVDRCLAEFTELGVVPIHPPEDTPWGTREMRLTDPDGNRVRFASEQKPAKA